MLRLFDWVENLMTRGHNLVSFNTGTKNHPHVITFGFRSGERRWSVLLPLHTARFSNRTMRLSRGWTCRQLSGLTNFCLRYCPVAFTAIDSLLRRAPCAAPRVSTKAEASFLAKSWALSLIFLISSSYVRVGGKKGAHPVSSGLISWPLVTRFAPSVRKVTSHI